MATSPYKLLSMASKQLQALMGAHDSGSHHVWNAAVTEAYHLMDDIKHNTPYGTIDESIDYSKHGKAVAVMYGKSYATTDSYSKNVPPMMNMDKCTVHFTDKGAANLWNGGQFELHFKGCLPGGFKDGDHIDAEKLAALMKWLGKSPNSTYPHGTTTSHKYNTPPKVTIVHPWSSADDSKPITKINGKAWAYGDLIEVSAESLYHWQTNTPEKLAYWQVEKNIYGGKFTRLKYMGKQPFQPYPKGGVVTGKQFTSTIGEVSPLKSWKTVLFDDVGPVEKPSALTTLDTETPADPPPKGVKWNGHKFVEVNDIEVTEHTKSAEAVVSLHDHYGGITKAWADIKNSPTISEYMQADSHVGAMESVDFAALEAKVMLHEEATLKAMQHDIQISAKEKAAALSMESMFTDNWWNKKSKGDLSKKVLPGPNNLATPKHGKTFDPYSQKWVPAYDKAKRSPKKAGTKGWGKGL